MQQPKNIVYFNNKPNNKSFICSGVAISEFVQYINDLKHIIIVKGECMGDKVYNNFEVFNNRKSILENFNESRKVYGDVCFIDYENTCSPSHLSDNEIAYMLYCAHMFKVKQTTEINTLKNSFIFMSHDDDFYMKLYYNSVNIIYDIIEKKIINIFKKEFDCHPLCMSNSIKDKLVDLCKNGILITKKESTSNDKSMCLEIRCINDIDNMDLLYNETEVLKSRSNALYILHYYSDEWYIY